MRRRERRMREEGRECTHEDLDNVLASVAIDFLEPTLHVAEADWICKIEYLGGEEKRKEERHANDEVKKQERRRGEGGGEDGRDEHTTMMAWAPR